MFASTVKITRETSSIKATRDEQHSYMSTEAQPTTPGLIAHQVVSTICLILVAVLFGSRLRDLTIQKLKTINVTRVMVFGIYLFALVTLVANHLLLSGIPIVTAHSCTAAVITCLAAWAPNKGFMYLFLLERAHATRASRHKRIQDPIWLVGMAIVVVALITLSVESVNHVSGREDGICEVLLNSTFLDLGLGLDLLVNVGLTLLFVIALFPALRFRTRVARMSSIASEEFITDADKPAIIHMPKTEKDQTLHRLDRYFRKVAIGSVLIVVPTAANLGVLKGMGNQAPMWLCLILCALDVTGQVCIVHWLTLQHQDLENR